MADDNAPPPPPPPSDDSGKPKPNSQSIGANVDTEAGISTAKGGGTDALGSQVHPDTQTSEADGHRTLVNPVTDPGPVLREGMPNIQHPGREDGNHRYGDVNEPIPVRMRTSTGHANGFARGGEEHVTTEDMAPDLAINGAASDMYHPHTAETAKPGASLTAEAQRIAAEPREPAPLHE